MATKQCSVCSRHRPTEAYSNAQLKKKGKRVCVHCLNLTDGPPSPAANDQSTAAAAAANTEAAPTDSGAVGSTARSARSATATTTSAAAPTPKGLTPLAVGTYPSNSLFTSPPIAYEDGIAYYQYEREAQLPLMQRLIERDLSEPYSIFTYRYFVNFWPQFTLLAMRDSECIGCIVCRLVRDKAGKSRGYIAMLAVETLYRNRQIGSRLVRLAIEGMRAANADLVVLEAEVTNKGALALYEKLNFVRETRLVKYYLSGSDAFRLKLWLKPFGEGEDTALADEDDGDLPPAHEPAAAPVPSPQ